MSRSTSTPTPAPTRRDRRRLPRAATVALVAALSSGVLANATAHAAAAEGPQARTLRALCQADGGYFFPGRFGEWRCQQTRTDGMSVFWAERTVCEQAGRLFFQTVHESGETGSWVCSPSSI